MKTGHGVYIDFKISCDYMWFFYIQFGNNLADIFFTMYSVTYVWYEWL